MEKLVADAQTKSYFDSLEIRLNNEIAIANKARKNGKDPKPYVEIPIAKDLADRVENIIGVQVAEKIRSFEGKITREEASLIVGRDVAQELSSTIGNAKAIEKGVRVAVAMLTEGVVAAPIEGIDRIDIAKNDDGTYYIKMFYAGPIRSAGGTAQALSILICDFIRRAFGIDRYKPRKEEVDRYIEEIGMYQRVANLQYMPSEYEIKLIVENCPICIDGEPTEEAEVEGYRNLERVDTNRVRGGMALVLAEGLALKAPKVQKHVKKLQIDGWEWLDLFLSHTKKDKDEDKDGSKKDKKIIQLEPNEKYLRDLIAGRPVFSHPSRPGGFRLRYGRSRNTSLASSGISPAGMIIMDNFISTGTQLKMERPGKAASIVPVDSIEGPTVRLKSKSVIRIDTIDDAYQLGNQIECILDVGEILINYGDFLENNHILVPASYCFEWWIQDLLKANKNYISEPENVKELKDISQELALELSDKYHIPLHPKFTYLWHDITKDELKQLSDFIQEEGRIESNNTLLKLPYNSFFIKDIKPILEKLLVLHTVKNDLILIESPMPFIKCLGLDFKTHPPLKCPYLKDLCDNSDIDIMQMVNQLSGIIIKKRAPIRIGARMGRPGKSDKRKMDPSTHVLFPIGNTGGTERKIKNAADFKTTVNSTIGKISVEIGIKTCPTCNKDTYKSRCDCGEWTIPKLFCPNCDVKKTDENKNPQSRFFKGKSNRNFPNQRFSTAYSQSDHAYKEICPKCNTKTISKCMQDIDFRSIYHDAMDAMSERDLPNFKGINNLSSKHCTPEPFEKGVLRSKYELFTFKDGTTRYDMSDVPLTHLRPNEIGVSVQKIKEMGYLEDIYGNPITNENQVLCLKVQDIVISEDAAVYLLKISKFIDDLLVKYYKLEPYYNAKTIEDMVGVLIMGLAPHTSAGILGRVIGYVKSSVCYAHPFFHAAKRRNCFDPDTKIPLLEKGTWKIATIKELVEKNLNNPKTDDFGTLYSEVKNTKTLTFNEKTKKFELADISHVSKHAPQKIITLRTKSGREITTTLDHPFPTKNGEKVALELEEVFTPHNIKVPRRDVSEFLLSDFTEDIVVKIPRDIFEGMNKKEIAEKYNLNYKTFTNYIYRRSYPLSIAKDFIKKQELEKYKISAKRDTVRLSPIIKCDKDFMFLLGIYLAEGHIRKGITKEKTNYQVGFAASDPTIKKLIVEKIEKVFGIKPYVGKETVTLCSRIIYYFFLNLRIGNNAREKSIPSFVFSLPKKKIRLFLAGLFSGDGSVSLASTLEVNYSSVSKKMIDEISFLLLQFGIKHSFSVKDDGNKKHAILHKIRIYSKYAELFVENVGFKGCKQEKAEKLVSSWKKKKKSERTDRFGEVFIDKIVNKQINPKEKTVYSLTVPPHHTIIANGIVSHQCDGDEDCIMLVMDGLLNFSMEYLPDKRGGKMDAPLVLTSHIEPSEVDGEAHNVDVCAEYPIEFYEATEKWSNPKELEDKIDLIKNRLGTPLQYTKFMFTHDTTDIAAGPTDSAYKTIEGMENKMNAQLSLGKKIRAVDESNVAERVLTSHFLPDMIGNLRAFSRQGTRCIKCGKKYRRPPLKGNCIKCGGKIILTVHEDSVKKYLNVSIKVANEYEVSEYTRQRIELLGYEIKALFESDKSKQMGLGDFM